MSTPTTVQVKRCASCRGDHWLERDDPNGYECPKTGEYTLTFPPAWAMTPATPTPSPMSQHSETEPPAAILEAARQADLLQPLCGSCAGDPENDALNCAECATLRVTAVLKAVGFSPPVLGTLPEDVRDYSDTVRRRRSGGGYLSGRDVMIASLADEVDRLAALLPEQEQAP